MGNKYCHTPRCTYCGKFCLVADEGTQFGSSQDIEPPEEDLFCAKCAEKCYNDCIQQGRIIGAYWLKPQWERRAAHVLGYVAAGPPMAAWSQWFKPERVPEGWEIHNLNIYSGIGKNI